jgi:hypothetical protein
MLARASREEFSRLEGVDLSDVRFADPYGLLGLIALGSSSHYRRGQVWGLILPRDRHVISFLERSGALSWLEKFFVIAGSHGAGTHAVALAGAGMPILEVAHVKEVADVHRAVARVKGRADRLIIRGLGYNSLAADRFTVALAEICQNIIDHSEGEGFVMARLMPPARKGGGGGWSDWRWRTPGSVFAKVSPAGTPGSFPVPGTTGRPSGSPSSGT